MAKKSAHSQPVVDKGVAELRDIAAAIHATNHADVIVYNGRMWDDDWKKVVGQCPANQARNVILVLKTYGGDPNVAYRVARHLQACYDRFSVLVPGQCKSGGTLLAIGAHELIMSDSAELGPLDMQRRNREEYGEQDSALTLTNALSQLQSEVMQQFLDFFMRCRLEYGFSTKNALDSAQQLAVGLFEPIYAQFEPSRIGENARLLAIAEKYGERLNAHSGNLRKGSLAELISSYAAHDFVIDRKEAKELFKNVREPNELESRLVALIGDSVRGSSENALIFRIHPEKLKTVKARKGKAGDEHKAANRKDKTTRSEETIRVVGVPRRSSRKRVSGGDS